MAEDKIRVGIIGASARYGWGMRSHLPALLGLPEYELAAVCTSSHDTAKEAARHYGARMAFDDYKEMVQHPEVDVVSVSVRVPLHYSMVMAALAAGKHVFCEWPLGANMAETENMATLAQSKGVQNIVTLQSRTDPALMRLRELIEEGYVGEVLSCSMTMFLPGILERGSRLVWTADRLQGATTLSISTGHAIDALCFLCWGIQGSLGHGHNPGTCLGVSRDRQNCGRDLSGQRDGHRNAFQWRCRFVPHGHDPMEWKRLTDRGVRQGGDSGRFDSRDDSICGYPAPGKSRQGESLGAPRYTGPSELGPERDAQWPPI